MATHGSSQLSNVKRSFEKWFGTNFGSTYSVDYDGVPFNFSGKSEWLQPRILVGGQDYFHRHVDATHRGDTLSILVNVNIFVRKGINQPADRLQRIRDVLFEKMAEGTAINIYDYTNDGALLTEMRSRDIITDREIISNDPEAPRQYNFSVRYNFLRKY